MRIDSSYMPEHDGTRAVPEGAEVRREEHRTQSRHAVELKERPSPIVDSLKISEKWDFFEVPTV